MALWWDIKKCKDLDTLTADENERRLTDAVVFATLVYDLGGVTEKNLDEWLWRQEFARRVDDYYPVYRGAERSTFTRAELDRRVGLVTNVTNQLRPVFIKKIIEKVNFDVNAVLRYQAETTRVPAEPTERVDQRLPR